MTPPALGDLIARIESAAEGSEALDREIGLITGRGYFNPPCLGSYYFTRSLDAAMTLIPANRFWLLGKGRTRPDEPMYGAQILDGGYVIAESENDASPALALCAAVLKARKL